MRTAYLYGLIVLAIIGAALTGLFDGEEPEKVFVAHRALLPGTISTTTTTSVAITTTSSPVSVPDEDILSAARTGVLGAAATTTPEPPPETSAPSTSPPPSPTTQPPATSAPTTTAPPPPSTTEAQGGPNGELESQFASLINSYRADNGLPGLTRDGSLDSRARSWSENMAADGGLSHSSLGSLVPPWSAAAENVAIGGSVGAIFDALAGSSGHRSNMLGDYTHFGVGVWVDSSGTVWTTHVFTR